jgi:FAD synthetase
MNLDCYDGFIIMFWFGFMIRKSFKLSLLICEMVRVLVFGSFDIVHKGHVYFLEKALALGDELVVVVGRDKTIEKVKGKLPLNSESERVKDVESLGIADEVVLGHLSDKFKIIEEVRPDVIALGYDQESFSSGLSCELRNRGLDVGGEGGVEIVRLEGFEVEKYKSSLMRKNIK